MLYYPTPLSLVRFIPSLMRWDQILFFFFPFLSFALSCTYSLIELILRMVILFYVIVTVNSCHHERSFIISRCKHRHLSGGQENHTRKACWSTRRVSLVRFLFIATSSGSCNISSNRFSLFYNIASKQQTKFRMSKSTKDTRSWTSKSRIKMVEEW